MWAESLQDVTLIPMSRNLLCKVCSIEAFVDSDPRAGVLTGRLHFGPNQRGGEADESLLWGYRLTFVDACGAELSEFGKAGGCEVPAGATAIQISPYKENWHLLGGASVGFVDLQVTSSTTTSQTTSFTNTTASTTTTSNSTVTGTTTTSTHSSTSYTTTRSATSVTTLSSSTVTTITVSATTTTGTLTASRAPLAKPDARSLGLGLGLLALARAVRDVNEVAQAPLGVFHCPESIRSTLKGVTRKLVARCFSALPRRWRAKPSKKELTLLIHQTSTSRDILEIIRAHNDRLDSIHAITCLWKLGKLKGTAAEVSDVRAVVSLVDAHLKQDKIATRGLSNILVALTYINDALQKSPVSQRQSSRAPVFKLARRAASLLRSQAEDANAHDIANAAWAQAAAGRPPGSASSGGSVRPKDAELLRGSAALLLRRLAPVARQRLKAFSAQAGQLPKIFPVMRWCRCGIAGLGQSGLGLCCCAAVLFPDERAFRRKVEELFHAVAETSRPKLQAAGEQDAFNVQEMSNLAWAFAKAGIEAPELFAALAAAAHPRLEEFTTQNLCNFAWAFASLSVSTPGAGAPGVLEGVAAEATKRVSDFNLQGLSNLVWASAVLGSKIQVFELLARELTMRLDAADVNLLSEPEVTDIVRNALGVVWAQHFAHGAAVGTLVEQVKPKLRELGRRRDRAAAASAQERREGDESSQAHGKELSTPVPTVVLQRSDCLVIQKPPGWQVDQQKLGVEPKLGEPRRLTSFVHHLLSPSRWPLLADTEAGCGFVHRLDAPCSGLILLAKTYEAYYDLLLQMNSGQVVRDYIVLCHGWVPSTQETIAAPLYWAEGTHLPSEVRHYGKPSVTQVKVLAHARRGGEAGLQLSLVAVRILTGRRHQIRIHMAHAGHCLVGDGKYGSEEQFLEDKEWCSQTFLHRYHLGFTFLDGTFAEANAPLPTDLVAVLEQLCPRDACSAAAMSASAVRIPKWDECQAAIIELMGCEFDRASRGPLREEEQEEKDEKGSVVMVTYLYVWYKTLQGEVYYRRSTKGGGLGEEYYQGKKYILSYSESKKTLVSGVMAGW
ncbi:unnamed protein product, partial [Symbiodinium microadriaticum]